jgi:hypothetical protein
LPRLDLQLAGVHGLFHVDACVGEAPEMLSSPLGVDEMEGFVPLVEAVFDKRAKHTVLLVDAVEERANVAILAESVRRNPQRIVVGFHTSPPTEERWVCSGQAAVATASSKA